MANHPSEIPAEPELNIGQVQSEPIAFTNDEMVPCTACSRANPPNRLKCLYCGAGLEVAAEFDGLIKLVLRKLESWEKGFNLIYLSGMEIGKATAGEIADILGRDASDIST